MSVFAKLKNTINKINEEEGQEAIKKKVDISVLNGEEVKIYSKLIERFRQNIEAIEDIGRNNRQEL